MQKDNYPILECCVWMGEVYDDGHHNAKTYDL